MVLVLILIVFISFYRQLELSDVQGKGGGRIQPVKKKTQFEGKHKYKHGKIENIKDTKLLNKDVWKMVQDGKD